MPEIQNSRQRAIRIPLDYYKQADRYTWLKTWLSVAAMIAVLVWIVTAGRPKKLATHGVLASVHATLDEQCDACHVPFTAINGTSWSASLPWVHDARASDAKCQVCHTGMGVHHANIKAGDENSCASCHRDHRGRDTHLSEVPDPDCTRCHADLENHVKDGAKTTFEPVIKSFGIGGTHPEFALFRAGEPKDPGRLKFNHKEHMLRGQPKEVGGEALKKLADLLPEFQAKYKDPEGKDAQGIQLNCAHCHRPSGDRSQSLASQSTSPGSAVRGGAYMAKATYEADCVACHPLDYDNRLPPIRHGLQPDEVYDYLLGAYSALYLKGEAAGAPANEPAKRQAVPGRDNAPVARGEALERITSDVARAQQRLLGSQRCGECHYYETPQGGLAQLPADWAARPTFRIARPKVKDVWFEHARFDHASHKSVQETADCKKCHERAYADHPRASTTAADVLIPTSQVCRECHTPHDTKAAVSNTGAGYSCAECHGYHGGDKSITAPPAAGAGRNAALESDLRHFLAKATGR